MTRSSRVASCPGAAAATPLLAPISQTVRTIPAASAHLTTRIVASVVRRDDDARRAAAAGLYGVLPNGNSRLAVVVEDEDVAIPPFTRYTRVAPFPRIVTRSGLTSRVTPSSTAWTGSEADSDRRRSPRGTAGHREKPSGRARP